MENDPKKVAGSGAAPTFTPPTAPTFTPPAHRHDGPSCHYHADEAAVTRCARCGKYLCEDCAKSYGFTSGEYAGKSLCYDCTMEIWKDDEATLKQNYAKIKAQRIACLIGVITGAVLGLLLGIGDGLGILETLLLTIGIAAVGGSVSVYVKGLISRIPGCFVSTGNFVFSLCLGILKFMFWMVAYAVVALIETIRKLIYYSTYMKDTANFLEENSRAMQSLTDYMEYTLVRNQYQDVDLETLLKQDSKLADNSFAQMVQSQGEEGAEATIRQCVARINENGEIIRSFEEQAA